MVRRLVVLLAAMIGLVAVPVTAMAAPAPYPPGAPSITLSPSTITLGGTITISGTGFGPGEVIDITFTVQSTGLRAHGAAFVALATPAQHVTASAEGSFTTSAVMDTEGTIQITATGETSGFTASATETVTAAASTTTAATVATTTAAAGLPNTGVNRTMLVIGIVGGALAIIIGGGLVWLGASRRPRHSA